MSINLLCEESTMEETLLNIRSEQTKRSPSGSDFADSKVKKPKVDKSNEEEPAQITDKVMKTNMEELILHCRENLSLEISVDKEDCIQIIQAVNPISDTTKTFPLWTMVLMMSVVNHRFLTTETPSPLLTKRTMELTHVEKQLEVLDLGQLYRPLTALMTALKRNLTTSWANWPLSLLLSTYQENIDTSIELPCSMDLMEFWDVCKNCERTLADFPRDTGLSSQVMENTSMLSTFVNGSCRCRWLDESGRYQRNLVNGNRRLFELPGLTRGTGEQSCVTYLTTRGSSKKLAASQKMNDYILDLNIYRKQDLRNLAKSEYWTEALRRIRVTCASTNPILKTANRLLEEMYSVLKTAGPKSEDIRGGSGENKWYRKNTDRYQ
ncbi:Hypothetical protein CINCED_3A024925 [Cinara cedri]|uniref:Uncharacterized protein n=1 Tax=Cinara cedri TaxID=506608 RepID=A0A5E4NPE1_9HEMI|nr:Hypothetical protein CINCED_3A024925 [Cinara cedri]